MKPPTSADIVTIGAGAAGLMASIAAARQVPGRTVVALDGAKRIGAKILVAGGGRCNVTHHRVDEKAFAGSTPAAIRKVLRRFDATQTVEFFRDLGVELKREDTGKLFPVTDSAKTVLDALLGAARAAGVRLCHPCRVESIEATRDAFAIRGDDLELRAPRVILATGGKSLPKTGSDGHGHHMARTLGHTITERVTPALVPLLLRDGHPLRELSGISTDATLEVRAGSGRRLASFTGSTLCTHFGLSGPAVLDVSRYLIDARFDDPDSTLVACWLPGATFESVDATLRELGARTVGSWIRGSMPERLARTLCSIAGLDAATPGHALQREPRRALAHTLVACPLEVVGDRGYRHAEVTAGGVPLAEIDLKTMASRVAPGLHLCGEICDVDGRIGGFNFQWAWASGHVAGIGATLVS